MYVEKINQPADIKKLTIEQLNVLRDEIRDIILEKVSKYGGHVGPDLGMIEATIAMHYVFDSPIDKIVFDVSHQSFAHKILTGRREGFINNTVSEYTNPNESPHDFFIMGHTAPAVSMCCGLAKGRDLQNQKHNVIAIIGDGAMSGGEAYEGFNNASQIGSNLIIVVNDNQWSIAENHGGLYKNLKELRESNGASPCNFFKALDLDYVYLDKGNDIAALIDIFQKVKDCDHPIVVHINTLKGKGFELAIKHEEEYHYKPPFDLKTGNPLQDMSNMENYEEITGAYLQAKMKENPALMALTSATPSVIDFTPDIRQKVGQQFMDVGIAEEHAVAFSSGVAKSGAKAVYPVFGTFLQRSFDQLSEDLSMQNNPAVVLVFLTGVYGIPDQSHQCFFDIIEISNIPNMVYLAPICKQEYLAMLDWAVEQHQHPVAIRVPTDGVHSMEVEFEKDYSQLNKFKVMKPGKQVAIVAVGSFFSLGQQVAALLEKQGMSPTLVSPRYLSGVDTDMLDELCQEHQLVVTLEDGIVEGGYGQKIAGYYGPSGMKVKNYGFQKVFVDRYNAQDLMKEQGVNAEQIADDILNNLL